MKKSQPYQPGDGNEPTQLPQVSKSKFFKVEVSKEQRESIINDLKACNGSYALMIDGCFDHKNVRLDALRLLAQGNIVVSDLDFIKACEYNSDDPNNKSTKKIDNKVEDFFYRLGRSVHWEVDFLEDSLSSEGLVLKNELIFALDCSMYAAIQVDLEKIEKADFFSIVEGVKGNGIDILTGAFFKPSVECCRDEVDLRILAPGPFSKNNALFNKRNFNLFL